MRPISAIRRSTIAVAAMAAMALTGCSGTQEAARQAGDQVGQAAKDAVLSCPCGPASGTFVDAYTKALGQAPGTYSVEAYDAATILLKGIDSGAITRPALLDFVTGYNGQGLARTYQWTDTGELTSNLIWIYKVQ